MTSFDQRVIGAAKLDVRIYEEVETDTTAMPQAMGVVALSSVAAGIGAIGQEGNLGLLGGLLAALLGWALWSGLTYFIGTRILPTPQTHADWGELLRTTGFAAAPGILPFGCSPPLLWPCARRLTIPAPGVLWAFA